MAVSASRARWPATVSGLDEAAALARRLTELYGVRCVASLEGDRVLLRITDDPTGSATTALLAFEEK